MGKWGRAGSYSMKANGTDENDLKAELAEGTKTIVKFLGLFNFLLMLAAFALCGMGVYGLMEAENIKDELELYRDMPIVLSSSILVFTGGIAGIACLCGVLASAMVCECGQRNLVWQKTITKRNKKTGQNESSNKDVTFFFELSPNKTRQILLQVNLIILFACLIIMLCIGVFMYLYGTNGVLNAVFRDRWFEEGNEEIARRIEYQDYFDCCGWESAYDSRASGYNTACPRINPESCIEATASFFESFFYPIAIFGIIVALLELVAVVIGASIIFVGKQGEEIEEDDFF